MKILKKEDFLNPDVSTIGGYVDQVGGELLAKALIGGTTAKYVNLKTGIKQARILSIYMIF